MIDVDDSGHADDFNACGSDVQEYPEDPDESAPIASQAIVSSIDALDDNATGDIALDDIDRALLAELTRDGRISIQALAERVGVARATAYSRVRRLEDGGVITGYRAVVEPAKVGRGLAALILLGVRQDSFASLPQRLARIDGVEWLAMTTGEHDFAMLVRAADPTHLRDVVLGELQTIGEVLSTHTILVLDEPAAAHRRR